ncbi:hypothetical protein BSNK01_12330 [Bacillaceae bacterium]
MKVNGRTIVPRLDPERESGNEPGPVKTYRLSAEELQEVWRKYGPPNPAARRAVERKVRMYREQGMNDTQIIELYLDRILQEVKEAQKHSRQTNEMAV